MAIYLPPQTLKFHVCDPSGPRLLTAAIYYNYLNWGTDNARVPLVAVTVIIERLLYLRRSRVLPSTLLPEVLDVVRSGRVNAEVIVQLEQNSPLGRVLAAGLRHLQSPREVMKEAIAGAGRASAASHTSATSRSGRRSRARRSKCSA